ncbi:SDR family NAD(P)-dependent oxidoreductase [Terrabacter terrigena]|uniref:SDR family NAD(P)-dependent oxidoreductase n=1 Tax=Terrabacter terrigena TaxID=574718 RepID=A0ABW3N172_9MICO
MSGALSGRVALVTGAGRGIGAAIAEAYAREGASLCLADRDADGGIAEVSRRCEALGVQTLRLTADVSDEADVVAMFGRAEQEFGGVDVVVNNAGILTECRVEQMSTAMWDEMIAVDLRSVFLCSRAALPHMQRQGFGRIINVASQLGQKGGVGLAHYSAAKAGVIGFTRALAREVGKHGITANCIAPGPIDTPLADGLSDEWIRTLTASLPLGRFGAPHEVAPTAVLLASDPAGNIYTGQTLGPNSGDVML